MPKLDEIGTPVYMLDEEYQKTVSQRFETFIRGLFKIYVDFCCRDKANRYPVVIFV